MYMFRTALISMFLTSTALAETWTVDDDGKADFDNIQDAVDASSDGDEILVMPGTYTSTANEVVNMLGKQIWLHSSKGAEVTIINGEDTRRGIYCYNGETSKTIIEGFTITNGYSTSWGAGMYNDWSSPTLIDCTFENNTGQFGGGVGNNYSSSTLTNCTFTNNNAHSGAGMYNQNSSPTLINCTFTNNNASLGGGMNNWESSTTLTNCTFTGNTCSSSGGGMWIYLSSPTLNNCQFENNSVGDSGGGMKNWNSSPTITNCTFTNNIAERFGGGMDNWGPGNTTITNCTLTDNTALYGDGINTRIATTHFFGTNTSDGLNSALLGSFAFNTEATCDVTGSISLPQSGTISFDIHAIDTSSLLNVSHGFGRNGGLVVSNDSGSLLGATEENIGDIIPLAQASTLNGNFDSIVFPPMPEGLGLQLINPALRGGGSEVAAEVIEVEGANFADPFSGDLDSPPIDIISFDADGDGRDEVAVLFGGTPGGVACYSVSEDGTPTLIDGYAATLGDDPVDLDAGDLNGDGLDDLLVVDGESATLSILVTEESGGSLTFVESTFKGSDTFTCVAMIDWGGDSALDAVVGVTGSASGYQIYFDVSLFASIGPWLEIPDYQLPDDSYDPDPPTCVDGGNQTGDWGFVGGTRYGRVHRGTSGGSLQVIDELEGNNTVTIEAIELDEGGGDGQIDLMVSSDEAEMIYLFQGNAAEDDGFGDLIPLGVSLPVEDVIALDADDDGDMDIVMTAPDSDTPVTLLRNDGASGGLLPTSLPGLTWSMQVINSASDVARLTSGGLSGKDEEDDWIVGGGSSTGFRGETVGVIEQSNILLDSRCDADVSGDGEVNVTDLLAVIDQWGSTDSDADISGDGVVDVTDLLEVVGNWGPCE